MDEKTVETIATRIQNARLAIANGDYPQGSILELCHAVEALAAWAQAEAKENKRLREMVNSMTGIVYGGGR